MQNNLDRWKFPHNFQESWTKFLPYGAVQLNRGKRDRVCMVTEKKTDFKHVLCQELSCRSVLQWSRTWRRRLQVSFLAHHLTFWAKTESAAPHSSSFPVDSFVSPWNFCIRQLCLQPTVKILWSRAKDDIHTELSQHKPLRTGKLQNRCQAMWLHSGGPFQRT